MMRTGERRFVLRYGRGEVEFSVPERHLLGVVDAEELPGVPDAGAEARRALGQPIGSAGLRELVWAGARVAVVVSDKTRPSPTGVLLPPVLEELRSGGVREGDITVVFALGIHPPHTEAEKRTLVGQDVFDRLRCVDSLEDGFVPVGITSRGTPVEVSRPVAEADLVVATGNIEFHYFAGYSGGAKALIPGVASRKTILPNHAMQTLPGAEAGRLAGNPVREDLEEAAAYLPPAFLVNVVLNAQKAVVECFAGDLRAAHRAGCALVDQTYKREIPEPADIVIASAGGHPKDINVYQAQKALDNAICAARPGGAVILLAACPEGLGEETLARWLAEATAPQELVDRLKVRFELGGHKAAAIARAVLRARVYLVSTLEQDVVRELFFVPAPSVGEAVAMALEEAGGKGRILVMPSGGSTLPVCADRRGAENR